MKLLFRGTYSMVALISLCVAANASPIVWVLNGVALSDGGTANGTFTFNPDSGAPCGSFSPCGTYSNVNIRTTTGSSRTGASYMFVCGESVAACTGVSPDSTEVLFLASNATNQSGDQALAFFFTGLGDFPPQGLTDAGGIIDISSSSGSVGAVREANCANAACTLPAGTVRYSTAGTVSATPEPATWLLLLGSFALFLPWSLRRRLTKSCFSARAAG